MSFKDIKKRHEAELLRYANSGPPEFSMLSKEELSEANVKLDAHADALTGELELAKCVIQDLERERDALQAKVDALMFEYCPGEMTKAQLEKWAVSQMAVTKDKP